VFRLTDKVVFLTGCGSVGPGWGNGKSIAVLFARQGARIFGVDISEAAARETQAIITGEGGTCEVATGDVTDSAQVARLPPTRVLGSRHCGKQQQTPGCASTDN
jgi:NAD(P)-dependent dehydrogenase (short-subunit alcohol dehydrogenase family)